MKNYTITNYDTIEQSLLLSIKLYIYNDIILHI